MSWGDEKDEAAAARDDTQAKTASAATEAPLREDVPARGKGKNTSSLHGHLGAQKLHTVATEEDSAVEDQFR